MMNRMGNIGSNPIVDWLSSGSVITQHIAQMLISNVSNLSSPRYLSFGTKNIRRYNPIAAIRNMIVSTSMSIYNRISV